MRLSPNKIEFMAEEILAMMEKDASVHIQTNADLVYRAVADIIYADIKAEDDLDAEVDELLEQYKSQIRVTEMDVGALRTKMKRELAKKKGFIL